MVLRIIGAEPLIYSHLLTQPVGQLILGNVLYCEAKKKMSVALSWGHLSYFLFYRTHEHQKACYYSVQKWEQNHLLIPWCLQYITAASNLSWDIRARRCHIERAEIMKISANQISFDRIFCKIHYSTSKGQNFMISGVPQCCRKYLNTLINVHTIKINSI